MGRPVMLGNGSMVVGLNELGLVHDFYYPYVGQENLTTSRSVHHKIGVWVNNSFTWIDDKWQISVDFELDALISVITAYSPSLGIELNFSDFIDHQYNAFCRKVNVINKTDSKLEVRVFFHQVFQISNGGREDTALYVPRGSYIFDYKGRCSLLIYACGPDGQPFDQFAIGNYAIEGKAGTYVDAEDGELSGNLIEHGGVDSVIRCRVSLEPDASSYIKYWVVASDSQVDAEKVHNILLDNFDERLDSTKKYWNDWLNIAQQRLSNLDAQHKMLVQKSLLIIKAHIDKHGGILASCDSSIYNYDRDYYTYVWPRDGALTVIPLINLGFSEEAKHFIEFCADTIHPAGYMMHKYQPDRAIGSTWHPLMHENHPELAIQEDETASVIYIVGLYLEAFGDEKFVLDIYKRLVKPATNFMSRFIDDSTNLPHASYDLWEQRFGTHTYTVLTVYSALTSAVQIAQKLGFDSDTEPWLQARHRIKSGFSLLIDPETGIFRRSLNLKNSGDLEFDTVLDSATNHALLKYGQDLLSSEQIETNYEYLIQNLANQNPSGGVGRYLHDDYFLKDKKYLGNSWFICTFWLAQYKLSKGDRSGARDLIDWTISRSLPSSVMSEQISPDDGRQVGVAPLVWSHAEQVTTLIQLNDNPQPAS